MRRDVPTFVRLDSSPPHILRRSTPSLFPLTIDYVTSVTVSLRWKSRAWHAGTCLPFQSTVPVASTYRLSLSLSSSYFSFFFVRKKIVIRWLPPPSWPSFLLVSSESESSENWRDGGRPRDNSVQLSVFSHNSSCRERRNSWRRGSCPRRGSSHVNRR